MLEKVLFNRSEIVLMYRDKVRCSCGYLCKELTEMEKHLKKEHQEKNNLAEVSNIDLTKELNLLKNAIFGESVAKENLEEIKISPNCFYIVLNESEINGGRIKNVKCPKCLENCSDFQHLSSHVAQTHPRQYVWRANPFILESKLEIKQRAIKGITYFKYFKLPLSNGYVRFCRI